MDSDPPDSRPIDLVDEQDLAVDTEALRALAALALDTLRVPQEAALTITLVDRARIAELKRDAFGVHAATDVLSFPIDSLDAPAPGPLVLGDIVICVDVAQTQARALGRTLAEEMSQLLVHGILHLLGADHADVEGERAMYRTEHALLGGSA